MTNRDVYKSALFTKEESVAIDKRIFELMIETKKKLSVSDYIRQLVQSDLNGNAPSHTQDDKQDNEQTNPYEDILKIIGE